MTLLLDFVVAVRDLGRVAIDGDRAGSRLAGDVVVREILDVEAAAGELNRAADVEHDDLVRGVLDEGAAERAGAAVVEVGDVVDGGGGKPAAYWGGAGERPAGAFGAREEGKLRGGFARAPVARAMASAIAASAGRAMF